MKNLSNTKAELEKRVLNLGMTLIGQTEYLHTGLGCEEIPL